MFELRKSFLVKSEMDIFFKLQSLLILLYKNFKSAYIC